MSRPTIQRPLVLCGPSGVGKSTVLARLFSEFPNEYGFSVSHTTRQMRPGEVDGVSYHFVTRPVFAGLVDEGAFLEHAEFGGNLYGTTAKAVQTVSEKDGGRCRAILDIDSQGVKLIKAHHAYLDPVFLFLSPPAYGVLQQRLEGRSTDSPEAIARRLQMALCELQYAREPGSFDYVIVNEDLDHAYTLLRAVARDEAQGATFDAVPPADDAERAARAALGAEPAG
ncbi:guanylate kinase [Malassezia sp. CBS 17886]|nr:guanylate kinase [Malassezia sp. CBS 17886]